MANACNKCKGSTPFGFIIITILFIVWFGISLVSPLGIVGDVLFRYTIGIKLFDYTFPPFKWFWPFDPFWWRDFFLSIPQLFYAILQYLLDIIPFVGPTMNFLHFWSSGEF